jgi:hypothetical protein
MGVDDGSWREICLPLLDFAPCLLASGHPVSSAMLLRMREWYCPPLHDECEDAGRDEEEGQGNWRGTAAAAAAAQAAAAAGPPDVMLFCEDGDSPVLGHTSVLEAQCPLIAAHINFARAISAERGLESESNSDAEGERVRVSCASSILQVNLVDISRNELQSVVDFAHGRRCEPLGTSPEQTSVLLAKRRESHLGEQGAVHAMRLLELGEAYFMGALRRAAEAELERYAADAVAHGDVSPALLFELYDISRALRADVVAARAGAALLQEAAAARHRDALLQECSRRLKVGVVSGGIVIGASVEDGLGLQVQHQHQHQLGGSWAGHAELVVFILASTITTITTTTTTTTTTSSDSDSQRPKSDEKDLADVTLATSGHPYDTRFAHTCAPTRI